MNKRGMTGIQMIIAVVIGLAVIAVGYMFITKAIAGGKTIQGTTDTVKTGVCMSGLKLKYQMAGKELPTGLDPDGDGILIPCDPCECPGSDCKNIESNDLDKDGIYKGCDKPGESRGIWIDKCEKQMLALKKAKQPLRCCYPAPSCIVPDIT